MFVQMSRYFDWTSTMRASTLSALGKNSWPTRRRSTPEQLYEFFLKEQGQ